MITTTIHGHPLLPAANRQVKAHPHLPGASVREILLIQGVDAAQPLVIYRNDRLLTVEEWDSVCPLPGDVLNVLVQPAGGGGKGGSNPVQIVAMVAIMVVAPYIAGALNTSLGLGLAQGSLGMTLLTGAVSMVGNAVIGALFKPSSSPSLTGPSVGGAYAAPSPTYSLSGGSNRSRPYEAMPLILGTHRFFPDLASRPYTEYIGDDQYLYQIFHLGLSDASFADWRIGTTPVSDFSDVQWIWPDAQGRINSFPGNVDTTAGAALTYANGPVIRRSSPDTYQLGIDIEAMMYYANDAGGLDAASATINIEYRQVGSGPWLPAGDYVTSYTADGYWSFGSESTVYVQMYDENIGYYSQPTTSWVQFFYDGSTDPGAPHNTGLHWNGSYYGQWRYQPFAVWRESVFGAGGGWEDVPYPRPPRPYVTTRQAGYTISGASQKPIRRTLLIPVPPGTYEVRITRVTADNGSSRMQNTTSWSVLRSYQADTATYADQKRVGLIIRASEQLNGTVQQLSCTATAICTYWNGSAWVSGATANPAHWFMAFAKGKRSAAGSLLWGCGLSDAQIDLAGLHEWAAFCDAEGLTFGMVLDTAKTAADVLNSIARCGFGSPSWATGTLGAVWDARNQPPVAMFGMGNILKGSFSVEYISDKLADEIIVSFVNPAKDWQTDQVRKVVPGTTNPERPTTVDIEGCTSPIMAGKFANYLAAQQYYRRRHVTWDCDFEGFVCQRGDVVLLSHDLTQWGYSGRIVSASGRNIRLDRAIPRSGAVEYFMLKRPDGSMTTYAVQAATGESDTLTLTSDPVFEADREVFDHTYAFSPLATPGKRVKIISVQPISESRLRIVATDENPEFYAAWDGDFVATGPSTLLTGTRPAVSDVKVSEQLYLGASAAVMSRVTVSWQTSGPYERAAYRYRVAGGEWVSGSAMGRDFTFDTERAGNLDIEITPLNGALAGSKVVVQQWLLGLLAPPADVTGLTDVYRDGRTVLVWRAVTDPRPIMYEVRKGAAWATAQVLGQVAGTEFLTDGDGQYWVAAASGSAAGRAVSQNPAALVIEGAALVANVVASFDEEATGWSGSRTDGLQVFGSDVRLVSTTPFSAVPQVSALPSVVFWDGVAASGIYTIPPSHEVDIGTAQACTVSCSYRMRASSTTDLVSKVPLVSAWASVKGNYSGLAGARVEIATAPNSGTYGAWRDFVPGEYFARKFKLRVVLESFDPTVTAVLDTLVFTVDMPDRIEKGTAVNCPAAGMHVAYAVPFQIIPNVQITGLDAAAGDDVILSNQTASGFDVQVKNTGTGVSRSINWLSQGY